MKKKISDTDELRPHYDFDYDKMKPNRFAGEKKVYKQTFVVLDEDVSKVFQSSEDVNIVLRSAIRAMRATAPKLGAQKRRAS
jgi:acid phosphatase class B